MRNIRMAVYGLALVAAPAIILQGCAAPMIAAAATSAVGYQTLQTTQPSDVNIHSSKADSGSSMSCSQMRTELSAINRTIQEYYGDHANATMQQFPSGAGSQLAMQAATDVAAQTAPGAIAYVQPLMASAKDLFNKFNLPGGEKKIAEAQSRKAYLEAEYARSCTANAAAKAGDPVTKEIQSLLNQMDYPCGRPDGIAGAKTDEAIRKYQSDRGLLVDGRASPALLAMMKREASMSAYE